MIQARAAAWSTAGRNGMRSATRRLRAGWVPLLESTVAATAAWVVSTTVIGHPAPFFAPASAIIVLGQARGMRIRRTLEILIGIAGGVLLADVVARLLGTHTTLTVFTLIVLTLTITTAIGANGVAVTQAAVSALYVAVVAPATESLVPFRFIDALVGGSIALLVNQIAVVHDPLAPLVAEMRSICERICDVIELTATALDRHDEDEARRALEQARSIDKDVDSLRTAVAGAAESLQLDLWRRSRRANVAHIEAATRHIDYVVRGVRVLARAALTLTRWPPTRSAPLGESLRHLTAAVGYVGESLIADVLNDPERSADFARRVDDAAMAAVAAARPLLRTDQPLPVVMMIGQLRSITIDLLRGVGSDDRDVLTRVDAALDMHPG
jgi:uncharacterized membrane protein YgaE (UPF0421/DUF939 family)